MLSRRSMLSLTAQAALTTAFASTFTPLLAAADKRKFKIGACEWSLRKSDPSCFDVAKAIGLDGVQVDMGRAGEARDGTIEGAFRDDAGQRPTPSSSTEVPYGRS